MKKIIVAPDSFKGTMSSMRICDISEGVIKKHFSDIEVVKIPVADGGEGTVEAFLEILGGKKIYTTVKGPFFENINSFYGLMADNKTAVIEMAAAAGLPLVDDKKMDPSLTTTFGVGELIKDALKNGAKKIILGLGGSATNDGGAGMAAALGVKFFDDKNNGFVPTGGTLDKIVKIDITDKLKDLENSSITAMCDVKNPLCGVNGASCIFAPQKGADVRMAEELDKNLMHLSLVIKKNLGIEVNDLPGAGAAGGMGAGVIAFLNGRLKSGIDTILEMAEFDKLLENCDYVITGEGKIDRQSLYGKAVIGIADRAKKKNVPVIAVVGDIGDDLENIYDKGITAIMSINRKAVPFTEAKESSEKNLELTIDTLMRIIKSK